eukprot:12858013-Alexandrium_andersonii.AAC.1
MLGRFGAHSASRRPPGCDSLPSTGRLRARFGSARWVPFLRHGQAQNQLRAAERGTAMHNSECCTTRPA